MWCLGIHAAGLMIWQISAVVVQMLAVGEIETGVIPIHDRMQLMICTPLPRNHQHLVHTRDQIILRSLRFEGALHLRASIKPRQ